MWVKGAVQSAYGGPQSEPLSVVRDADVTQIRANKGIKGENEAHPQASND